MTLYDLKQATELGTLDKIPKVHLTEEAVLAPMKFGETLLHIAASNRQIGCIPAQLLTAKNLLLKDQRGRIPIHQATRHGGLSRIPAEALEAVEIWTERDERYQTVIHLAAQFGRLDQVPTNAFTAENLLITDNFDRTPLHRAAESSVLHIIPRVFLTEANMLVKDCEGRTPLAWAAINGQLNLVPDMLTLENLLMRDNADRTILYQSTRNTFSQDQLLGTYLPDTKEIRCIVGDDWFEKNLRACKGRKSLTSEPDTTGLDIF